MHRRRYSIGYWLLIVALVFPAVSAPVFAWNLPADSTSVAAGSHPADHHGHHQHADHALAEHAPAAAPASVAQATDCAGKQGCSSHCSDCALCVPALPAAAQDAVFAPDPVHSYVLSAYRQTTPPIELRPPERLL